MKKFNIIIRLCVRMIQFVCLFDENFVNLLQLKNPIILQLNYNKICLMASLTQKQYTSLPKDQDTIQDELLFTVQLKINNHTHSLPVHQNDTYSSLAQRFCKLNNLYIDKQNISSIEQRIMMYLQKMGKDQSKVDKQLKKKINTFIAKQKTLKSYTNRQKENDQSSRSNKTVAHSQIYTPFKIIQENPPSSKRSPNRHRGSNCSNIGNSNVVRKIGQQDHWVPKAIRKNTIKSVKKQKKNEVNKTKISMDPDLVQAYQVIYRKAKDSSMKEMAKKFLDECESLKKANKVKKENQQKKTVHKKEDENKLQDSQIEIKKPLPQYSMRKQVKQYEGCKQIEKRQKFQYTLLEQSMDVYQKIPAFSISISRSKDQEDSSFIHRLSRSRSGSRYHGNRIKYNIDEYSQDQISKNNLRKGIGSQSYDRIYAPNDKLLLGHRYHEHGMGKYRQQLAYAENSLMRSRNKRYNYLGVD